ncbi:type II secretion system protein [Pseudokineococcus sp. 1T1Z-3]|uniref:type II secretion system protein n=1 Tax=Pseudokineococcus sp. 1T1Z-3 TaxID=3132745 RepID=UPI0030B76E67
MLARIRKSIQEKDAGFTLVELLVVMIIIGILAAIAIPVFLNQRQKAVDSSIKSDLRSVAQEAESAYVDAQTYPTAANYTAAGTSASASVLTGARTSTGNLIEYKNTSGTGTGSYCLRGSNPRASASGGTAGFFWYSSATGGIIAGAATATAPPGC